MTEDNFLASKVKHQIGDRLSKKMREARGKLSRGQVAIVSQLHRDYEKETETMNLRQHNDVKSALAPLKAKVDAIDKFIKPYVDDRAKLLYEMKQTTEAFAHAHNEEEEKLIVGFMEAELKIYDEALTKVK